MMKRIILIAVGAWCAVGGAFAQNNPYISLQGAVEGPQGLTVAQPRTILAVDVTVECERTVAGPYARYAQKFLGLRAPLSDKTGWTVKDARTSLADTETALFAGAPALAKTQTYDYSESDDEFPRVQVDKVGVGVPTLEDASREAAKTIYALRRHRMDLITGEAGENVFGAGLQAALDEIDRLEQRYLELFLGKRTIATASHRYIIYPQADKLKYVVCRFSATAGRLPASDLTGDMVLLEISPTDPQTTGIAASQREPSVVSCRVAAPSECRIISGGREFETVTLPIFEFGRTIYVAVPRRK